MFGNSISFQTIILSGGLIIIDIKKSFGSKSCESCKFLPLAQALFPEMNFTSCWTGEPGSGTYLCLESREP